MTHEILIWLWRATLTANVAICVVLALRLVVRRSLGAPAAYLLWLLVPAAVLAMLLPAPARPLLEALRVAPTIVAAATPTVALNAAIESPPVDLRQWLLFVWLVGAVATLAVLALQQWRYVRALGPLARDPTGALRAQNESGSPALVGALFPRIVLPADFESRFDARERELVLAHERAHLGHGDAQVNALVALLRCLQWFNPFFHWAASRLRIDQELACDARVIARFPEARRSYADAMLKAQLIGETRQELRLPIGCYWPSSHPLKERISMLKLPVPTRIRRTLASAVAMVLALGAGYASWAAQPGAASTPSTASASDRAFVTNFVISIDGNKVMDLSNMPRGKQAQGEWEVVLLRSHGGGAATDSDGKANIRMLTSSTWPLKIGLRKDDQYWEVQGSGMPLDDGTIAFSATVSRNGDIVSKPTVIANDGEPVAFQVADKEAGAGTDFRGIRVDLTLTREEAARASHAGASSGRTTNAADVAPTEILDFRKMRAPQYPPEAVKARIQGRVMLKVQVDADGAPVGTEVAGIEPKEAGILADAAIAAAMQWRYKPGIKDGEAVGGNLMVPVTFALEDDDHAAMPPPDPQSIVAASYRRMRPPQYPAAALAERLTGTVWVRAHLNTEGAVTDAHAEQTFPLDASELAEAAVGTIRQWTFNPATVNGVAVDGDVVVPLHFAIDGYTPGASAEPAPAFPPQTPLLATVTVTGPKDCGKDCPPPPPPPPLPKPPLPDPPRPGKT